MDRRTHGSKLVSTFAEVLSEDLARGADATAMQYARADRCRICNLDRRDLPNAIDVQILVDYELLSNSTYKGALDVVADLVAEWPADDRPTYTAVRNHARRHLDRDQVLLRQVMETYAAEAGVDVEQDEGSILTPRGVLTVVLQKGYEEITAGRATPTIAETIDASRAMGVIENERLKAELAEARRQVRLLSTVVQEVSPQDAEAATRSMAALPAGPDTRVVTLPEAGAADGPAATRQAPTGFGCDRCDLVAKSERGLARHKEAKH
jgi:hypothetical protein